MASSRGILNIQSLLTSLRRRETDYIRYRYYFIRYLARPDRCDPPWRRVPGATVRPSIGLGVRCPRASRRIFPHLASGLIMYLYAMPRAVRTFVVVARYDVELDGRPAAPRPGAGAPSRRGAWHVSEGRAERSQREITSPSRSDHLGDHWPPMRREPMEDSSRERPLWFRGIPIARNFYNRHTTIHQPS